MVLLSSVMADACIYKLIIDTLPVYICQEIICQGHPLLFNISEYIIFYDVHFHTLFNFATRLPSPPLRHFPSTS
jgi:hypothetical protein